MEAKCNMCENCPEVLSIDSKCYCSAGLWDGEDFDNEDEIVDYVQGERMCEEFIEVAEVEDLS